MNSKILLNVNFYIILILLLSSCGEKNNPVDSLSTYSFAMYFLEDDNLSFSEVEHFPIERLILQKIPFLSERDIKNYTIFYIDNNPKRSYQITIKDSTIENFSNSIRPYVFVHLGGRICLGEYWPAFMSYVPRGLLLYKAFGQLYCLDPVGDIINAKLQDPKIFETLENAGVHIEYKDIGGS